MGEVRKSRVAVGVFDTAANLERAIAEFRAAGLPADGFFLVTNDKAFARSIAPLGERHSLGRRKAPRLVLRCSWPPAEGADTAAPGEDAPEPLSPDRLARFEEWIGARMSEGLNGRLADGACILFAAVAGAAEEKTISRILLHHAVAPVQLHDLGRPHPIG